MFRIMLISAIISMPLQRAYDDIADPARCTDAGYTRIYRDVTQLALDGILSERDRIQIIEVIRHEMCGKDMYADYEQGIERVDADQRDEIKSRRAGATRVPQMQSTIRKRRRAQPIMSYMQKTNGF